MKPTQFFVIALLALVVGCAKQTETLSSGGTVEEGAEAAQPAGGEATGDQGEAPSTLGGEKGGTEPGTLGAPGETTPAPPVTGEASDNPAVTEKSLVGKYDGKLDFSPEMIEMMKSMAPPEQREKIEADIKNAKILLELKSGGKYSLTSTSDGKTEVQNGSWTYDGAAGKVTLSAPEMTAAQIEQQKKMGATDAQLEEAKKRTMDCSVSKDGKVIKFSQTQMGMTLGMTFTKK